MDIFISYSSHDRAAADEICTLLKQNGITYWIAHENAAYGSNYSAEIIDHIDAAKLMLLLVTESSVRSDHVLREVNYAVNHNKPIIPIVIGEVVLSKEFEYYLSATHFLHYSSAIGPHLLQAIRHQLGNAAAPTDTEGPRLSAAPYLPKKKRALPILIAAGIAAVALLAILLGVLLRNNDTPEAPPPTETVLPGDEELPDTQQPTEEEQAPQTPPTVGENTVPAEYRSEIEAFPYQNKDIVALHTIRITVGEKAVPDSATVWSDCAIYTTNDAIAKTDGNFVIGVAPGEAYIYVLADSSSAQLYKSGQAYKVIVE